jgi:hypothetical protein
LQCFFFPNWSAYNTVPPFSFCPVELPVKYADDLVYRADAACFVNGLHTKAAGKIQYLPINTEISLLNGLPNSVRNFDGRTMVEIRKTDQEFISSVTGGPSIFPSDTVKKISATSRKT